MNLFLQVGLGLFPGTLITVLLLFKRKAFSIGKIFTSFVLTASCVTTLAVGGKNLVSEKISESKELTQKETMAFANALIMEGAFDEAREVIDEYSEEYGYDYECSLICARINLLEEDYDSAAGIYGYLCESTDLIDEEDDEVIFAVHKTGAASSDFTMVAYLKKQGLDPKEYGYADIDPENEKYADGLTLEEVKEEMEKAIKKNYELSDQGKKCVKAVVGVKEAFDEVKNAANDEEIDEDPLSQYKKTFKKLEEEAPQFLNLECVSKARIKAYVVSGDYASIAENLTKNSSYHEMMIAAELYMSGLVKKSNFAADFQNVNPSQLSDLKNQLNEVYEQNKEELSNQEKKELKNRINAVNNELRDPVLSTIKDCLLEDAEVEAGTDRTKVYLEIAKIESYFDNEPATDAYLSEAIYSSQDNEDDSYVSGMANLITVINNDTDTEGIKHVTEYVETVLDHSLTIDVEDIVSPQNQPVQQTQNSEGETTDAKPFDFQQTAVDYVSRVKSAIVIGKIDTENFETITARVQIDSDKYTTIDQIKEALKVYDCGAEIKDFEIRKIEYTGSNVILVCDVSGSMSGSIGDLSNAVVTFAEDMESGENIAVVTFDDGIKGTMPFGSSKEELIAFGQSLRSMGGTNMYDAVLYALEMYPTKNSELNVLILMTDGEDNNYRSAEAIYENIGGSALNKGTIIYTVGLGSSVSTDYLTTIANAGNGEFVYVSDSASLKAFYEMLHGQVYSQYEITYTAQDTITLSNRTLEVSLPDENLRDIRNYSLAGNEEEGDLEATQDLSVTGLNPRFIYKSMQDINVDLKGSGFTPESSISVKLNGNIDYNLEGTYKDGETFVLTIPSSIAVGTYDVEVSVDGKKKTFRNGFSVGVPGEEKTTEFGPYIFTSQEKIENNNSIVLRGNVILNGWLHYNGDVELQGDLEANSIRLVDQYGSYVPFDKATASGIGKYLAEKGIPMNVPAMGGFNIYKDTMHRYDYDNYQVDDVTTAPIEVMYLMRFDRPVLQLRPDSVTLNYKTGTTLLPYQDQILAAAGADFDMFSFNYDGSAVVTNENVGVVVKMEYDDDADDDVYRHQINLLNNPVKFNGQLKIELDTLKNEYLIGGMVQFPFFNKLDGVGAEIGWKGKLSPDSVKVMADFPVKLPTQVPLSLSEFSFMVSDINDAVEQKKWTALTFTGSTTIKCGSVQDYFPALAEFMGDDISAFSMPETTASLRLSPLRVEANATLMLLSEIKLAEASVQLGTFDYTNPLLQMDGVEVSGLSAKLKKGLMWDGLDGRASLEISGEGELAAHSRFIGVQYTGTASYNFRWWILNAGDKIDGSVAMGLYTTTYGKMQFILVVKYPGLFGGEKTKLYYIDENGNTGSNNGVLN